MRRFSPLFRDQVSGEVQAFELAGVGPPAGEHVVVQIARFDVGVVDVGDLQLAAGRRLRAADVFEDRSS